MTAPEPDQWKPGQLLTQARQRLAMSKTEAAKRSQLSLSWWRRLESGWTYRDGERLPVQASPEALVRAARAVGVPPQTILSAAGLSIETAGGIRAEVEALLDSLTNDQLVHVHGFILGLMQRKS